MSLIKLLLLLWVNTALSFPTYSSQPLKLHRKSLNFQPVLPHATFVTSLPHHLVDMMSRRSSSGPDPFNVARTFLDILLKDTDKSHMSYEIRNDSYTDARTGVTHVYVKQIVDGLNVCNGLMNINIFKDKVISYGDSFFRGPVAKTNASTPSTSVYQNYCERLSKYVQYEDNYSSNCQFLIRNISMISEYTPDDPRPAVLMFMIAATPSTSFADTLSSNFDQFLSRISARSLGLSSQHTFELNDVPGALGPVPVRKAYIQIPHNANLNQLKPVWKFEIKMKENWYEVATDVSDPSNIISVVDWASDSGWSPSALSNYVQPDLATYNVYNWGINDPSRGSRTKARESMDPSASPFGWHRIPVSSVPRGLGTDSGFIDPSNQQVYQFTVTAGNNIYAQITWDKGYSWMAYPRPNPGRSLNFDYPYVPGGSATSDPLRFARNFANASITQAFYTLNRYHDFLYLYGFDEKSGNFQEYNFDQGGRDRDAVILYGQEGSEFNNAFFVTPPDGMRAECHIFLWNSVNPYRDGDFSSDILIHEYTHGMSSRLTAGSSNSACLSLKEAGGMGEGWGDWFAIMINMDQKSRSGDHYAVIGAWASNDPLGIRRFPYTLNRNLDPLSYKSLDWLHLETVHDIGNVWAQILWIVTWRLVQKHGFTDSIFPPTAGFSLNETMPLDADFYRPIRHGLDNEHVQFVPKYGNTLMIQLVINGMKLQPCNPNFVTGRDAIIQADKVLTGGENRCVLWQGFAERGLGVGAKFQYGPGNTSPMREEDFKVPEGC